EMTSKRRFPRHPTLTFLLPSLGHVQEPETFEEELMEYVGSLMLFDGLSFADATRAVADQLCAHGIDPAGEVGQGLLATFVDEALDDAYGDFNRSAYCPECDEWFEPVYSLHYANQVLAGERPCPVCAVESLRAEDLRPRIRA